MLYTLPTQKSQAEAIPVTMISYGLCLPDFHLLMAPKHKGSDVDNCKGQKKTAKCLLNEKREKDKNR